MTRPTDVDLNLIELNYYTFMVSLDKVNGKYNTVDFVFRVKPERKMLKYAIW